MDRNVPRPVSRAQLARYAEVSRAAVTNWRKRGPDFPEPTDAEKELFDLGQVIDWLSSRTVPANARHPHEPADITYADRVRVNTESEAPEHDRNAPHEAPGNAVEQGIFHTLDGLRGTCMPEEAAFLVATLVFLRSENNDAWNTLREKAHRGNIDGAAFTSEFENLLPPFTSDVFQTLGNKAFTKAVIGVDSIDTRSEDRSALATAFEYSLSFLTKAEGKRSSEFSVPQPLIHTMIRLLASDEPLDSIYDPCCGTGGFLTAAARAQSEMTPSHIPRIIGSGLNWRSLGIARMNTLLHEIDAEFSRPGLPWDHGEELGKFDLVLTNPPFNLSHYAPHRDFTHESFRYGTPPTDNANFAWLQYVIDHLSHKGKAGVLMANRASSSANAKEVAIRSGMVEDGAVECIIALPDHLFQHTSIPVTLWIMKAPTGRCEEILFIDASKMGRMTSRTVRTLQSEDTDLILRIYRTWHSDAPRDTNDEAPNVSRAAPIREIRDRKYSLAPPIYVTGRTPKPDHAEQKKRVDSLIQHLEFLESRSPQVDTKARQLLQKAQRWIR